jgi:glycosyltransferase involved in cell wall biosynthesis
LLAGYAQAAQAHLAKNPAAVVLAAHTSTVAYLQTDLPLVIWPDCTFGAMVDFYPDYTNLCAESLRDGEAAERSALQKSRLLVLASDWAARTARERYGVDQHKIRVVPYGANISFARTVNDITQLVARRPADRCNLLFIGRIWGRKGGDTALELARQLNDSGLPTQLTLVGSQPDAGPALPAYVRALGFINKATETGRRQLDELFGESHFLVVPSRAEAYGIVFCEASSFGVPSLATQVGGIPTVVRNGINGQTFPLDAPANAYADFIRNMMRHPDRYRALAHAAFREYEARLNWQTAGRAMKELLCTVSGNP